MEGYTGLKTGPLLTYRSEDERDISYVPASWGQGFSAAIMEGLTGSPGPLALRTAEMWPQVAIGSVYARSGQQAPPELQMLTPEEAQKKYGIGNLKFESPIADSVARVMFDQEKESLRRQDIIQRSQLGGFDVFIASLGGAMLDPVSVAAGVFPATALTKVGLGVERAASFAGRVGRGALEGFAGSAALVPLTYGLSQAQQRPYGVAEAFTDVIFGTALGAGIHAGLGAFHRYKTAGEMMPGLQQVIQDLPREDQAALLRGAVASIMEGRPVNLEPLLAETVSELQRVRGVVSRIRAEESALLRRSASADEAATIRDRISELEAKRSQLDDEIAAAAARGEPDAITEMRKRAIDDEMWSPATTSKRKAELGAEFQLISEGANPEANLDMLRAQAEATGLRAEKGRVEQQLGAAQRQAASVDQVRRSFLRETGKLASKRDVAQTLAERTLARVVGRESAAVRAEIREAARRIVEAPSDRAAQVVADELAALRSLNADAAPLGGESAASTEATEPRGANSARGSNRRQAALRQAVQQAAEPYYDARDLSGIEANDLRLKEQPAVKADAVAGEATPEMREIDALTAEAEEDLRGLDALGFINETEKAYIAEADDALAREKALAEARATAAICLAS